MMRKYKFLMVLTIIVLIAIVSILSWNQINHNNQPSSRNYASRVCVSVYKNGRSSVWMYDLHSKKWQELMSNRNTMLTSYYDCKDRNLYYIDALSDSSPWQVFKYNEKSKRTVQITVNKNSKGFIRGDGGRKVFFLQPNNDGMTRVFCTEEKNGKYVSSEMVKASDDVEVSRYCLADQGILTSQYSESEYNKKYTVSKDGFFLQDFSIVLYNSQYPAGKKILSIKANFVQSMSLYNNRLLVSSIGKNRHYRLQIFDLNKKKLIKTVTEEEIRSNSDITSIDSLGCTCILGLDKNEIYFIGAPENAASVSLSGTITSSTGLYEMNLKKNTIERVDKFKNTVITDLSLCTD